jgi:hypothetical protein
MYQVILPDVRYGLSYLYREILITYAYFVFSVYFEVKRCVTFLHKCFSHSEDIM